MITGVGTPRARRALALTCRALTCCSALLCLLPFVAPQAQAQGRTAAGALPELSLYRLSGRWTNHDGRAIALADLRGETVVVAMVYTSCTMTCPLITREMQLVQNALPADVRPKVRFVLASFDPARDSVGALHRHASKMALDDRWLVVRGAPSDVRQLAVLLGVSYRQLPSGDFDHSNIISVLDADGVMRFQSPRVPGDREALGKAVVAAARAAAPAR
ncbi:MAG: SCO family protein [Gemmatimonadaceae bacterium]|nr:SCO family protein [Gemmatimonadaceae bacterium]